MVKKKFPDIIQTIGKRKRALAKVTLKKGKGIIRINSQLLDYYGNDMCRGRILEPIMLAGDVAKQVDINVNVHGGGWNGQAEASRLAIGRALTEYDKKLKKVFLTYDRHILVADVRRKEVRKPNDSKARKKRQKSYR